MGPKEGARRRVDAAAGDLVALSHRIHANPELGFEEVLASEWVAEALEGHGFADVERGVCGLPTAVRATAGGGPLHVVVCAEYDALPVVGHACGHNVIAAAGVGAAIALAEVADDAGLTVTLLGTPAEEVGGGKILMLERGAFEGAHMAMMVHPAPLDVPAPPIIAAHEVLVRYKGKAAHASSFPEQGVNAADAFVVAQVAIGLARQHMRPTDRVHGIVTKGGDAPNVVPEATSGEFIVRAVTVDDLDEVRGRVVRCFEAGALATGCELELVEERKPYAHMVHDTELVAVYRENAEAVGRVFLDLPQALLEKTAGSTDMGNVSLVVPSIHPGLGLDCLPAVNHQGEFAQHCAGPVADKAVVDGAVAMAWTAVDAATRPALRDRLVSAGQRSA